MTSKIFVCVCVSASLNIKYDPFIESNPMLKKFVFAGLKYNLQSFCFV